MIDKNIKRFCELVLKINEMNCQLDKEASDFYDGGYSFEECNKSQIEELTELQNEFKTLIKIIYS